MNKKSKILALLFSIASLQAAPVLAALKTTLNFTSTYSGYGSYDRAKNWAETKAQALSPQIDAIVGSAYPGFRGTADVAITNKVHNVSYATSDGVHHRYQGIVSLYMKNTAYAFDETVEKFPGMSCEEAEVEGRMHYPHAFYSRLETYTEGSVFHRVNGCALTAYSVVAVTN